jgi:transposase
MVCRCGSASLVVRRMTTGSARSCCVASLVVRGCWQIAATTRTGSGHFVSERGARANIPPKRNRKDPICFSPYLYRDRNLVERFFNKIKQCRRVATRYDKLAANYLAFVKLACIRLWLRVYECTA